MSRISILNDRKNQVAVVAAVIVLGSVVSLIWFYKTQTGWIESTDYQRTSLQPAKILVVVYSRTGNTLGAAKTAAEYFDADLIKVSAPQYSRDIKGQKLASEHADDQITRTFIRHDPVSIVDYDLVILCSPTWWFRPAVPLWSFVENHDFANKPVFLIMTGNSRRKEEFTRQFAGLVEQKNGQFLDSVFFRRGRVFWQKSPHTLNEEVRNVLKTHQALGAWSQR